VCSASAHVARKKYRKEETNKRQCPICQPYRYDIRKYYFIPIGYNLDSLSDFVATAHSVNIFVRLIKIYLRILLRVP